MYRIHQSVEKASSIHIMEWSLKPENKNEAILFSGENVKKTITEVRKHKSKRNLSLRESINILKINIPEKQSEYMQKTLKDIKACTWAENIELSFSDKWSIEIK